MPDGWISSAKAAARLHLSRESVIRRIQVGILRGRITPDGHWLIDSADIDRFIRDRAREATSA